MQFGGDDDVPTWSIEPPGADGDARAIAFDGAGNLVFAYDDYPDGVVVTKVDAAGDEVWSVFVELFEPAGFPTVAVDSTDRVAMAESSATLSIEVHQLDANGDPVWSNAFESGGAGVHTSRDLAYTVDDRLLVAGEVSTAPGTNNLWAAKLTETGDIDWELLMPGNLAVAWGIAGDADGNVLVAGVVPGNVWTDAWIAKLDAGGDELWSDTIDGPDAGQDGATDVIVDEAGEIWVVGVVDDVAGTAGWVRKYDADGDVLFDDVIVSGSRTEFLGAARACESIIVAGFTSVGGGWDPWLRRYHLDGTVAWTRIESYASGNASWWATAASPLGPMAVSGRPSADPDATRVALYPP